MSQTNRYWLGDLCYVMHDCWEEVCDLAFNERNRECGGCFTLADGRKFIVYGTAYGDGEYFDQNGKRYPVDSGTLGALLVDEIRDEKAWMEGGNIYEFDYTLGENNTGEDGGQIWLGEVCINTADSSEDDEYEDNEEDCEEDNSYYED